MKQTEVVEKLARWKHLGFKIDSIGDAIFGDIHSGPCLGWMASVMAPVDETLLNQFCRENPYIELFPYRNQLRLTNGLNLFSGALYLFGVHVVTQRTAGIVWNIVPHNVEMRELTARFDAMAIGGAILENQTIYFLEQASGLVLAVDAETEELMFDYPDFDTFLTTEINRLTSVANIDGSLPADFRLRS